MTTEELLRTLAPISRASVYRDLRALGIQPINSGTYPKHWPANTVERIRARRGLVASDTTNPTSPTGARLATLPELRNERRKAAKKISRR